MSASAKLAAFDDIVRWRDMYRLEMACQITHDSIHTRPGWSQEGADSRATSGRGRGSWTQAPAPGPLVAAALPAAAGTQATLF